MSDSIRPEPRKNSPTAKRWGTNSQTESSRRWQTTYFGKAPGRQIAAVFIDQPEKLRVPFLREQDDRPLLSIEASKSPGCSAICIRQGRVRPSGSR